MTFAYKSQKWRERERERCKDELKASRNVFKNMFLRQDNPTWDMTFQLSYLSGNKAS